MTHPLFVWRCASKCPIHGGRKGWQANAQYSAGRLRWPTLESVRISAFLLEYFASRRTWNYPCMTIPRWQYSQSETSTTWTESHLSKAAIQSVWYFCFIGSSKYTMGNSSIPDWQLLIQLPSTLWTSLDNSILAAGSCLEACKWRDMTGFMTVQLKVRLLQSPPIWVLTAAWR